VRSAGFSTGSRAVSKSSMAIWAGVQGAAPSQLVVEIHKPMNSGYMAKIEYKSTAGSTKAAKDARYLNLLTTMTILLSR